MKENFKFGTIDINGPLTMDDVSDITNQIVSQLKERKLLIEEKSVSGVEEMDHSLLSFDEYLQYLNKFPTHGETFAKITTNDMICNETISSFIWYLKSVRKIFKINMKSLELDSDEYKRLSKISNAIKNTIKSIYSWYSENKTFDDVNKRYSFLSNLSTGLKSSQELNEEIKSSLNRGNNNDPYNNKVDDDTTGIKLSSNNEKEKKEMNDKYQQEYVCACEKHHEIIEYEDNELEFIKRKYIDELKFFTSPSLINTWIEKNCSMKKDIDDIFKVSSKLDRMRKKDKISILTSKHVEKTPAGSRILIDTKVTIFPLN